jgi:hypothetical protein
MLARQSYIFSADISLTECNSGKTQNFLFEINTEIDLKNITVISDNNGTLICHYCLMKLLSFLAKS